MQRNKKKYYTGLCPFDNENQQPNPPFNGAGWSAVIEPAQKTQNGIYTLNANEVCIYASTWKNAEKALRLIIWSHSLFSGHPFLGDDLIAHNEPLRNHLDEIPMLTKCSYANIPIACSIAAKASRNRRLVYAIAKYDFCVSLLPVFPVDLEPCNAPSIKLSCFPDDHIRFTQAIIAAYSAIEDLGLEIRLGKEEYGKKNGKWNPAVKECLEDRLSIARINIHESILWTVRGSRTKVEKKRPVEIQGMAPWACGSVRDKAITIIDAISYLSWLRSSVASHTTKLELTPSLPPHDVINAQHLVRRLILEKLGFWRYHSKKLRDPS